MMTIDDAYNRILTMLFGEMLDRNIDVSVLMGCISDAVGVDDDLNYDEKRTLVSVAGQANRLLMCTYNVHTESQAEHWEETINRLCGDEPPYSYTDHVGDA